MKRKGKKGRKETAGKMEGQKESGEGRRPASTTSPSKPARWGR